MKRNFNKTVTVIALVAGVAGAWSIVDASSKGETIVACANKKNGQMRLLRSGKCTGQENEVRWNENGPIGPAGPQGPAGVQGAQGLTGPQGPAATLPPPRVPTQRVGDVGVGGGVIFFVDEADEYDFDYLEARNTLELSNAEGCKFEPNFSSNPTTGAFNTSETFGTGQANTLTLLSACDTGNPNPSQYWLMRDSIEDGWFVPSIAELKTLYLAELFGSISLAQKSWEHDKYLLSSSMVQSGTGGPSFWGLKFLGINTGAAVKSTLSGMYVRLIRAG